MWGYFAAGVVAGAVAAWQWVANLSSSPGRVVAPPGAGGLARKVRPSDDDFARTSEWVQGFVPYRMGLDQKLRLVVRQLGPIAWPDYAQRVGAWYGLI